MARTLPTAKVLNPDAPDGFMIVNVSDLTDEMVLADEGAESARRKAMKKQAVANTAQTQAAQAAADAQRAAQEAEANALAAANEATLAAAKSLAGVDNAEAATK
jgi:predicted nucleotidyltransferase